MDTITMPRDGHQEVDRQFRLFERVPLEPGRTPDFRLTRPPSVDEVLRWAAFLDQGDSSSRIRRDSIVALLDAADRNEELLHTAWTSGVRAVRLGSLTRSVVDLLKAALDEAARDAQGRRTRKE